MLRMKRGEALSSRADQALDSAKIIRNHENLQNGISCHHVRVTPGALWKLPKTLTRLHDTMKHENIISEVMIAIKISRCCKKHLAGFHSIPASPGFLASKSGIFVENNSNGHREFNLKSGDKGSGPLLLEDHSISETCALETKASPYF